MVTESCINVAWSLVESCGSASSLSESANVSRPVRRGVPLQHFLEHASEAQARARSKQGRAWFRAGLLGARSRAIRWRICVEQAQRRSDVPRRQDARGPRHWAHKTPQGRGAPHLHAECEQVSESRSLRRIHLYSPPAEVSMHGVRGQRYLHPRPAEVEMQGLRGQQRLHPRPAEVSMQGLRGQQHLHPRPAEVLLQGLRGQQHLHPRSAED